MPITVADILREPLFEQCRLLAAKSRIAYRPVAGVSVIEIPVERFVRQHEVVLTTAINVGHDPDLLAEFVHQIADADAAAMAIAKGPYAPVVPPEAIEAAEQRHLPLLEVPWELRFSEISEQILRRLLGEQFSRRERDQFLWSLSTGRIGATSSSLRQAERLGVLHRGEFQAIAANVTAGVGSDHGELLDHLLAMAEQVAITRGRRWVGTAYEGKVIGFLATDRGSTQALVSEWLKQIKRRFPEAEVTAGASEPQRPGTGVETLARYVSAAQTAIELASLGRWGRGHRLLRYRDVAVQKVLSVAASTADAKAFVLHYLGALIEHDAKRKLKLMPTLEALFRCNYCVSSCARQLNIRRQSLLYRLEQIERLTGLDLSNHEERFAVEMALRLKMIGSSVA